MYYFNIFTNALRNYDHTTYFPTAPRSALKIHMIKGAGNDSIIAYISLVLNLENVHIIIRSRDGS